MNGKLVSWTNEFGGPAKPTIAPSAPDPLVIHEKVAAKPTKAQDSPKKLGSSHHDIASPPATTSKDSGGDGGGWTRQAYYDATEGTSDGLTFLNHFGGTKGIPGTAAGGPA